MDELSYASPMRFWPPLGKFMVVLALLLASLISTSFLIPMAISILGLVLLALSTRLRFPRAISLALLEGIAIFLIGALIIAFVTKGGRTIVEINLLPIPLSLTEGGIRLGMIVFLRASAGVIVMLFFATSTPIPHLAAAMRQLRFPAYISELVILVYRYSLLLLEQLDLLYTAAQCRLGFRGIRNTFRTTGKLAMSLFIKSLEVADRSQVALNCRNFRGEFHAFRPPARMTLAWTIMPFFIFATLLLVNYAITNMMMLGW